MPFRLWRALGVTFEEVSPSLSFKNGPFGADENDSSPSSVGIQEHLRRAGGIMSCSQYLGLHLRVFHQITIYDLYGLLLRDCHIHASFP